MASNAISVAAAGAPLKSAGAGVIMLHGWGVAAEDILGLTDELEQDDVAYLAPQAPGHTWYPQSFLTPVGAEPYLSRSLATIAAILGRRASEGFASGRVVPHCTCG
jgi:esterase/lipase